MRTESVQIPDLQRVTPRGMREIKGASLMTTQNGLRLVDRDMMDKGKALDAALGQIERAFGKGSIMRLGQREGVVETEVVSTGSLGLDIAPGIGGLPPRRGRGALRPRGRRHS